VEFSNEIGRLFGPIKSIRAGELCGRPLRFSHETKRRDQCPHEEDTQEIQPGASAVGKPKKDATPRPRLEVLKVGTAQESNQEGSRLFHPPIRHDCYRISRVSKSSTHHDL
jgi:hypothetical protein